MPTIIISPPSAASMGSPAPDDYEERLKAIEGELDDVEYYSHPKMPFSYVHYHSVIRELIKRVREQKRENPQP